MAVEARHLYLFSPKLITNRETMNPVETNVNNLHNMAYSSVPPSSMKTAATEALILPPYNSINAIHLPSHPFARCPSPSIHHNTTSIPPPSSSQRFCGGASTT
ncbi:hypothetical protein RYX36_023383 [Vicia faba]